MGGTRSIRHEAPNKLHPISHQPCGCVLPVDGSSGIGNFQSHVPQDRPPVRSPRRKFICYSTEQEGSGVCQLVSGHSGVSDKRIPASLEILNIPVCVSLMELDPASHPEDQEIKTNNEPDYSLLEVCPVVLADPKSGKRLMNANKSWMLTAWRLSGHGITRKVLTIKPEPSSLVTTSCSTKRLVTLTFRTVSISHYQKIGLMALSGNIPQPSSTRRT
ncbi:hypothetical protein AX774_g5725 [Zancudomyces culisetae]|uniref:Uncharacterized protein n=1 Tax=Zancudomyces culisetae TaxID=1213189 RepID=A0A1R1PIM2_ZANCU|nr:hypothetical protein AX774_g5725 [Zancudomyces culisetae]|eukprot:OMH80831.1 hypothetical protein AX774_g5725 [Zancudomyces culisetae]